jgi:hypothetical protein
VADESPLGLRVVVQTGQLEIRWDRELGAIQRAEQGQLTITEGEMSEVIPFNHFDLQDGYVAYTPMTNDVQIRLEVVGPGGASASESARVVAIP